MEKKSEIFKVLIFQANIWVSFDLNGFGCNGIVTAFRNYNFQHGYGEKL